MAAAAAATRATAAAGRRPATAAATRPRWAPTLTPNPTTAQLAAAFGNEDMGLAKDDPELLADPLWRLDLPSCVGQQLRALAAAQPAEFAALVGELNAAQRAAVQGCFG